MQLYKGGYGQYQYYTVAEDEGSAIKNIQEKYNMLALPVTVELIDNIDGYSILPKKVGELVEENSGGNEQGSNGGTPRAGISQTGGRPFKSGKR